jgi:SAM-dependent methyltransferase
MTESPSQSSTRWAELTGGSSGSDYAARFAALAATGKEMHGEATFCANLVPAPARVLDAGCGTGRIAIRLSELGYQVAGVDLDKSMLAQARTDRPDLAWFQADLAELDLGRQTFQLVIAAGNVIPLLAPGTLSATMRRLTAALSQNGLLVTGFGLDAAHLPAGCPATELADYDLAAHAAGLQVLQRFATWDGLPHPESGQGTYCVTVHSRGNSSRAATT